MKYRNKLDEKDREVKFGVDSYKKVIIANLVLLLIAGASVVSATYVLPLGETLIVMKIKEAASGNLEAEIPLDIVAGTSGSETVDDGSFILNRPANVTLKVYTNAYNRKRGRACDFVIRTHQIACQNSLEGNYIISI